MSLLHQIRKAQKQPIDVKKEEHQKVEKPQNLISELQEKVNPAAMKARRTEKNQKQVTLRLETSVLKFFKEGGPGYQTRINAALKEYMERHPG